MILQPPNHVEEDARHITALYSLEPIGIGTAYAESLTSYIQRLANSHCVKLGVLIKEMLLPPLEKDYLLDREATAFFEHVYSLNSTSGLSQQISDIITALTERKDIHKMTMLLWSNIFNKTGLVKKNQSWCPKCYQDWRNQEKPIYQPLLWFIKPIEICNVHGLLLEEECPYCHKTSPVLSRFCAPGYCSKCGAWLGYDSNRYLQKKTDYYQYQDWFTRQTGILLSLNHSINETVSETQFKHNLLLLSRQFEDNEYLRSIKKNVKRWSQSGKLIEIESFLKLSFSLQIPVYNLLFDEIGKDYSKRVTGKIIKQNKNKVYQNINYAYIIRSCLNFEMLTNCDSTFPSLSEMSKKMGISKSILRHYCPDLCKQISDRHKETYIKYREKVHIEQAEEIKRVILDMHAQGIHPTFRLVKSALPPNYFNQNMEGYHTWKETCRSLGYL